MKLKALQKEVARRALHMECSRNNSWGKSATLGVFIRNRPKISIQLMKLERNGEKRPETRSEELIEMKEGANEMVSKVNKVKVPLHAPF